MNRPTLPKYVTRSVYTVELEKYCDELEEELEINKCANESYKKAIQECCDKNNCIHNCKKCWENYLKNEKRT